MALQAGVGFADGSDPYVVGVNAAQDALSKLGEGGGPAHAAIVMASSTYKQEDILRGVRSVLKDVVLVGTSTAGEIANVGPLVRPSVVIMLLRSSDISFFGGVGENVAQHSREAGMAVAESIKTRAGEALRACVIFPDVIAGEGAEIVHGVLDALGPHFVIIGGASGDDFKFEKTYQYVNDNAYSGAVVGLGMAGNVKIGIGVKHGWIPVGSPQTVTKSEGALLQEINGKPAIQMYEEYFGKDEIAQLKTKVLAQIAFSYPLGMHIEGGDEMMLRSPFTVDENGAIKCGAEIPIGSEIRLMVGSREEAMRAAKDAAQHALESLDGATPKAVIIFDSVARNKLFGERTRDEIVAVQEIIGAQVPLIGFYTYGEQAPIGGETRIADKCHAVVHNETFAVCVLGE